MIDQKKDDDGKIYIQLRKATEEEKAFIQKMIKEQMSDSDLIGKSIEDFSFTTLDGKTITKEDTKGKVVVLNFWFTSCKPCISEIPELNEVYQKYKDNGNVIFASITFNKKASVEKFLEKHPIDYPVAAEDRTTISKFNVSGYPTNIVIGKDGKIADAITGGFPNIGKHIESSIDGALKAK